MTWFFYKKTPQMNCWLTLTLGVTCSRDLALSPYQMLLYTHHGRWLIQLDCKGKVLKVIWQNIWWNQQKVITIVVKEKQSMLSCQVIQHTLCLEDCTLDPITCFLPTFFTWNPQIKKNANAWTLFKDLFYQTRSSNKDQPTLYWELIKCG